MKTNEKPNEMELRDYFAACAIQGLMTHLDKDIATVEKDGYKWDNAKEGMMEFYAQNAYLLADAMLRARAGEIDE